MRMFLRKAQMGILSEVFLLILLLVIFILFWNFYSQNTFAVGLLKVNDNEANHTCASFLFPLVSDEYVSSARDEELSTVREFREFLGVEESRGYPSPNYLLDKIKLRFPELAGRVGIKVFNGTEWVVLDVSGADDSTLIQRLITGAGRVETACSLPLYALEFEGAEVVMSVMI